MPPVGSIFLLSTIAFMIMTAWIFRLMHAAIQDRDLAMRRKPPVSPGDMKGLEGMIIRRVLVPTERIEGGVESFKFQVEPETRDVVVRDDTAPSVDFSDPV